MVMDNKDNKSDLGTKPEDGGEETLTLQVQDQGGDLVR